MSRYGYGYRPLHGSVKFGMLGHPFFFVLLSLRVEMHPIIKTGLVALAFVIVGRMLPVVGPLLGAPDKAA